MKTKALFLILALLFINQLTFSQAPNWQWAYGMGGSTNDNGWGICSDAAGNIYATGGFNSFSMAFGSTVLTKAGSTAISDAFVVKYDSTGTVLWAKSIGGIYNEEGFGICTDASGYVYVTGYMESPTVNIGSVVLTHADSNECVFVIKFDAGGNALWGRTAGGLTHDDVGKSICADAGGNILVTGKFSSSTLTIGSTVLTNTFPSEEDIFVAKFDSGGNPLWAASGGGATHDMANGLATDAGGNVYVTGYFRSMSVTFGSIVLTNADSLTDDIFIAKYNPAGQVLWAVRAGGTTYDAANGICTDADGNIYVTGNFQSTSLNFGSTVLTCAGSNDMFCAKYDSAGTVLWAVSSGGTGYDIGNCVSTDAHGSLYVAGHFSSVSMAFGSTVLSTAGNQDCFLAKYDSSGNALWAVRAGGVNAELGNGLAMDPFGSLYLTGSYRSSSFTFGSSVLTNTVVPYSDAFVAKLQSSVIAGMQEVKMANDLIFLSPNPATRELVIRGMKPGLEKLEIYNTFGELVYHRQGRVGRETETIDVSRFLPGIYIVRVMMPEGTGVARFVKD